MLVWLPLLAGGVAASWLLARRSAQQRRLPAKPPRSIERLRAAIIGNDKAAVFAVFGPPRASAGFAALAPAMLVKSDYLHADTWYYPIDPPARGALVVQFDKGIAAEAHLVRLPPVQT